MKIEEVRKFALSLPEATEQPHFEKSSFRIRGKVFATVPLGNEYLHVFVDENETRVLVAENPLVFEELWWGKTLRGVRVRLGAAESELVSNYCSSRGGGRHPLVCLETSTPNEKSSPAACGAGFPTTCAPSLSNRSKE